MEDFLEFEGKTEGKRERERERSTCEEKGRELDEQCTRTLLLEPFP